MTIDHIFLIKNWDLRFIFRNFAMLALAIGIFCLVGQRAHGQQNDAYVLGSGDQVRVNVYGHEDLSGDFEISSSGNISLPLINEVKSIGLTIRELEKVIINKLKPDFLKNPQVSIEVLNYRPFYIIGQVKKPGSYPYVSDMSVVNAIALAGGYTYRAKEGKVLITRSRDGKQAPATHSTTVMPGDVIEVPQRFF